MMELSVLNRLIFLKLMPLEGDITTNRLVQKTVNDVGFTEQELAQLKFVNLPDGRTQWDSEAAKDCRREFEFGPVIYQIVKEKLQEASDNGKLPRDATDMWDKFMEKTKLAVVPTAEEEEASLEIVEEE